MLISESGTEFVVSDFFDAKIELFKFFGYVEDWKVYAVEDYRDRDWCVDSGTLIFFDDGVDIEESISDMNYYSFEIQGDRFLSANKWKNAGLTMFLVATGCDGNKYLAIFDDSKMVEYKEYDKDY